MRYFIVSANSIVTNKIAYAGDDTEIDSIVANLELKNPSLGLATEVDQATFDSTAVTPVVTPEQAAWQKAKAAGTLEALTFMAIKLGLE